METLNEMLARNVRLQGGRTFIIGETETLTYAQFDARVSRLANVLSARGVAQGDPVGLYLPGDLSMALGFWACQKLGAIPVPMAAMYRRDEAAAIVQRTGMHTILVGAGTWAELAPARDKLTTLKSILCFGEADGTQALAPLMAAASDRCEPVRCAPDDISALFFTSGTTGTPKGTMQTQFSTYSTLRDMMVSHRTRFAAEIYMCAVPLFTNFGLTVNFNLCLYTGGTIVLHERWDTRKVLDAVKQHRCTYLAGTPTMIVYLVREFDKAKDDVSSLRLCTTGGSPVPREVMAQFEAVGGCPVLQVYGATETCGQNVMEPLYGARRSGAAGVPVGASRIEILDDNGNPVPRGTVGEVAIGGDCVAKGYWRDPDATAKAFTPRGWMSGDLGYLDDEGYLFIVDRKKDIIIAGGYNILPLEVETVLYRHPAVGVCAVLGIPDAAKGEVPVAVVQRTKEHADATAAALIAHAREHLSAYKAPRKIFFIDEMPLRAGKIRKRELADWIGAGVLKESV
jgi:acyl-CoA synthetase (AMP-forming)/AMP-acid ligase II